jgi:hypothetical protein
MEKGRKEKASMPRGDQTGPLGMGKRTGRAAGYCADCGVPGYANPSPGCGFGNGRGFGRGNRGCRNMFYATGQPGWMRFGIRAASNQHQKPDPEAEKQVLESHAQILRAELDVIEIV